MTFEPRSGREQSRLVFIRAVKSLLAVRIFGEPNDVSSESGSDRVAILHNG